jgi:clan AA aspartic protease (TIGR02281 family)
MASKGFLAFCLVALCGLILSQNAVAQSFNLKRDGGVLVLPVQVNDSITLNFIIDSGAADVVVPLDVFSTLSRAGTIASTDMMESQSYELADGSRHEARRFRIRSLKLGELELHNVVGSVAPAGGSLLLGQSFLSRLHGWSIDNQRELLIVGEPGKSGQLTGKDLTANTQRNQSLHESSRDSDSLFEAQVNQFNACTNPYWAKIDRVMNRYDQMAILYPRFGLAWNEYQNSISQQSARDPGVTDNTSLTQARSILVERVLATAEPDAVEIFNLGQATINRISLNLKQVCGAPPERAR